MIWHDNAEMSAFIYIVTGTTTFGVKVGMDKWGSDIVDISSSPVIPKAVRQWVPAGIWQALAGNGPGTYAKHHVIIVSHYDFFLFTPYFPCLACIIRRREAAYTVLSARFINC